MDRIVTIRCSDGELLVPKRMMTWVSELYREMIRDYGDVSVMGCSSYTVEQVEGVVMSAFEWADGSDAPRPEGFETSEQMIRCMEFFGLIIMRDLCCDEAVRLERDIFALDNSNHVGFIMRDAGFPMVDDHVETVVRMSRTLVALKERGSIVSVSNEERSKNILRSMCASRQIDESMAGAYSILGMPMLFMKSHTETRTNA